MDLSFQYQGIAVTDEWTAGARFQGSQTRYQSRQRIDGTERYRAELPTGEVLVAHSKAGIRAQIRAALEEAKPEELRQKEAYLDAHIHHLGDCWVIASRDKSGGFRAPMSSRTARKTGASQYFGATLSSVAYEDNTYTRRSSAIRALLTGNDAF